MKNIQYLRGLAMLRPIMFFSLIIATPILADFSCPVSSTPLERKDEAQWMKACLDSEHRLHGPFEVLTRSKAVGEAGQTYLKTTEGRYAHGRQTGKWTFWNIDGVKISEKTIP